MKILDDLKSKRISIEELSKEDLSRILNTKSKDIIDLMNLASLKKENNDITYSKNVFIPVTEICKNDCGYCNFKKSPEDKGAIILKKPEEILHTLSESEKYGCKEALFAFGEDADEEKVVKEELKKLGYTKMIDYTYDFCKSTLEETNLLPHTNCGNLSYNDMKKLKEVNVSMGLMLESSSKRLMKTIAHEKSPGKSPKHRIETITKDKLKKEQDKKKKEEQGDKIQIKPYTGPSGIEMENYPEPSLMDMVRTVSLAKLLFDNVSIQVPPNLNYDSAQIFLLSGADDWGGVSPLTDDYVNASSPWPTLDYLNELTVDCGNVLKERLAVYEKYINPDYLSPLTLDKTQKLQNELNKT